MCVIRGRQSAKKKGKPNTGSRLDFAFLIYDMLADDGIVFLQLDLLGAFPFVLGRRVEVAGLGRGNQFDQLSHRRLT